MEEIEGSFNPTIFMLRVSVAEEPGPMKGTPKPFRFQQMVKAHQFKQVQINPGEDNGLTIDIGEQKTVFLED
ncbi:Hypothetical protein AA314_00580 [Archangium gephyra]|uniref:Uncharacterized protein n=1 Tax=Archangium gephyra TaxID=48 RepID=A0AAC8Q117_9BACT|nr:Hypothetical protein AA314_00580 [Archangium gephyra]